MDLELDFLVFVGIVDSSLESRWRDVLIIAVRRNESLAGLDAQALHGNHRKREERVKRARRGPVYGLTRWAAASGHRPARPAADDRIEADLVVARLILQHAGQRE